MSREIRRRYRLGPTLAQAPVVNVALSSEQGREHPDDPATIAALDVEVAAGESRPVQVAVEVWAQLAPDQYQVVDVIETEAGVTLGGVTVLVGPTPQGETEPGSQPGSQPGSPPGSP